MPNYNITATSVKKENATVTNTDSKRFKSPAEFADQAAADKEAKAYADFLNRRDYQEVWDWVGTATPVA
jgi:hypothetical protein